MGATDLKFYLGQRREAKLRIEGSSLQGYLDHKKPPHFRTLQQAYA